MLSQLHPSFHAGEYEQHVDALRERDRAFNEVDILDDVLHELTSDESDVPFEHLRRPHLGLREESPQLKAINLRDAIFTFQHLDNV